MASAINIAIVGSGVSGLAVAYNIKKAWIDTGRPQPQPNVTIYEASHRPGGNVETTTFSLETAGTGQPLTRWAGLGVNDFNASAYVEIVK